MPTTITKLDTGLVYRNARPHLYAKHAIHPSLAFLGGKEILVSYDIGQGPESMDYRTYVSRTTDLGKTWTSPARILNETTLRPSIHSVRIGALKDGSLIAMGIRAYRDDPDGDLVNRANMGYVESDLITLYSRDKGYSWLGPNTIKPPLVGPAWETCHRVVELADGRVVWPTSTWRDWNGRQPNGMKAVALVSHDKGKTFTDYLDIIDQSPKKIWSWEQGFTQLPDGRLVAVVWSLSEKTGKSLPTLFAVSDDGKKFGPAKPTGLHGQTAKLLALPDGRILCAYRRDDKPGLWANVSRLEGKKWVNLAEAPLWQGVSNSGMTGKGNNTDELSGLRFGFPSMTQLPNGDIFLVFWAMEDCVQGIRWIKLRVG
jgi:hypothetical protein